MATAIWVTVSVLSVVMEMLTGTFYLLVLGLAALAGATLSWASAPVFVQLLAFAAALLGGFFYLRARRPLSPEIRAQDVGSKVQVLSVNADGSYRVRYRGTEWDADSTVAAEPGATLVVRAVKGIRLQCSA